MSSNVRGRLSTPSAEGTNQDTSVLKTLVCNHVHPTPSLIESTGGTDYLNWGPDSGIAPVLRSDVSVQGPVFDFSQLQEEMKPTFCAKTADAMNPPRFLRRTGLKGATTTK